MSKEIIPAQLLEKARSYYNRYEEDRDARLDIGDVLLDIFGSEALSETKDQRIARRILDVVKAHAKFSKSANVSIDEFAAWLDEKSKSPDSPEALPAYEACKPRYIEGRGIFIPVINKVLDMKNLSDDERTWYDAMTLAKDAGKELFSKKESRIIAYFIDEINELLRKHGGDELDGYYWSSAEYSQYYAWGVGLASGNVSNGSKFSTDYVRAVSAF